MGKDIIWLAGMPGSGKTWHGDYLATRGWHHVDGDVGLFSQDPKVKEAWGSYKLAWNLLKRNEATVPEEHWKPYLTLACRMVRDASEIHDKVVITAAPLDSFGELAFLREQLPGCRFIKVTASIHTLLERQGKRSEIFLKEKNMTYEQFWASDWCKESRERFGEEWTMEKQVRSWRMLLDCMKYPADCEDIFSIDNMDLDSGLSVKMLNKLVGLDDLDTIDKEAIAQVNYARFKNFNKV